ncbi:hypothetical protein AOLI_G00279520 [Acnodon oligacanthus]
MASPHLRTPSRDLSLQTQDTPSISPGTSGLSDLENYGQPENYFQPINGNDPLNGEYASITAGSPSTFGSQNPTPTEQPASSLGAQHITSPGITPWTPSLQTCSMSVTQSLSNITTSALTTEISSDDLSDFGARSSSTSSTTYSLLLHANPASKTPSPQLLLDALNAVPSSHVAETPVQLGQSIDHASSSCSEQLHENSEVISQFSHHQRSTSDQLGRSSEVPDQVSDMNSIQQDAKELEKYIKQDKMDCISADKLLPGDDSLKLSNISDPPLLLNGSINPKIPVEENVSSVNTQEPLKNITTLPGLSSAEASLEMPSVSEMPQLVSNVSINQIQHNQPNPSDLKPDVTPMIPEAKSGGSADYMPVLYLQVTKTVQEETQRATDSNQSQHPTVSTTSVPKKLRFRQSEPSETAAHVFESPKKDDVQNLHEEQAHNVLGNSQKNPPVVRSSTTTEQRNKKVSATSAKIHRPIYPGLETQQTHWPQQDMSRAHYNSCYGSVYPNYHQFSDTYSMHYSGAHHAWMDLNGHRPQMESEAQLSDQKYQKEEQNEVEQSSLELVHNSNQLTSRQKRSKDKSARVDQGKPSPYWSENYAKYYNYGGWDPQGYYSSAYYQDYYYPYDYGYQAKVNRSNSQQYNMKPDNYDDWWKYDPRYDSTFDHDHFAQYQQCYWDQCDRQSSHSGYSTQSMPSTCSQHSRISWHSEQSWGYPTQNTDHPPYDVSSQSPDHSEDCGQLGKETSNEAFNLSCSLMSPSIPEQFSFPRCCARFGPGGQLIQVLPNLPSEGRPALVQIHSTEMLLQDCWDQPELQTFPGPLTKDKTHKSEVLDFVRKKYEECLQNDTLADQEASCLIWELLELVCKQNGKLVGTDISHLLLRKQRSPSASKKATSDLIDFKNEAISRAACNAESTTEDTFLAIPKDAERDLQCLRELLIFGKKKDALDTAISKGMWGHAFMLASKMDSRAYSQAINKFIDSLPENDALRTFYQLISGKIPLSATHCGIKEWGDWCIHLAMVLSNHTRFKHLHKKTITRMGDALALKGCSDAASFCYMVVQLDVDTQNDKSDIFLFGSSCLPPLEFATNEAIQRTELFEYALSLGCDSVSLPRFQIFKFIYACRLAESGLCTQAFQYCEVISKALLASVSGQPLTLISQLIELSTKMRHFDQQLKDIPDLELSSEPEWLINLRRLHGQIIEELNSPSSKKQDTNCLPLLEKDSQGTSPKKTTTASYKVSLMTTKIPSQEEVLPKVCLVPPAPQDILKKRTLPKLSQALDPGCFGLGNKTVVLPTSPISQRPPHHSNSNLSPVEEPVQAPKPQTVPESHLHILPSTAALLPERLFQTDDAQHLSEHQPNEVKESTPTLALLLPAPLSLHPTIVQSQFTEDLQSQSLKADPTATQFPMEPHTLSAATLPSSTSVPTESESLPQVISPYIESHTLPSSKSLATGSVHDLKTPYIDPHTVSSTTLSSSKSLTTESESVPQFISPHIDAHKLPSTTLPSSMTVATESEFLPQLIAQQVEPHTLNTTTLPSSMSLATVSEPVPQLISPNADHHTIHSTALSSSKSLATEFSSVPQSTAPYIQPRTLPSTALPSSMSLATQSESVPQLSVPLPVPPSFGQVDQQYQKQQPITQTSVPVAPPIMASANQHWVTQKNLCSHEVQPGPSRSTSMLCPPLDPQPMDAAVSNGRSQPTYTMETQTVPLLTVPLPPSHILPPSNNDYSPVKDHHVAQTEFMPSQTSCLPADPMLGPPPSPSANPYAMREKMAHSNHMHMPPKALIPRLFVPQSPPPDPKPKKETGGGWFSWLFGKKKEVNLPADTGTSLVWDENLQIWLDPNEEKKKVTTASSGDFGGPTAGLLSTMPALRPGPKRGYMAPLNPVLMSYNPGIQLYASTDISNSEAQMVRPANTYLVDNAVSGQSGHMRWTQNSQPAPHSQTAEDILQEIM